MNILIADTGALYAMADTDDAWHKRIINYLTTTNWVLIVPTTVIVETTYIINTYLGVTAEQKFLQSIITGELKHENITLQDFKHSLELIKEYSDANIGFVDASVVSVAERLKVRHILTTDRRHFSMIKPKYIPFLTLLP